MVFCRQGSRTRRAVASLVLLTFMSLVTRDLVVAPAAWAATPREELTKAEDYFQVADFATALQKVDALLKAGDLEGSTLRDAHILKARCELGLAHRSNAVDSFCQALRVDAAWRPDPDFYTKDEVEAFDQARTTCATGTKDAPKTDTAVKPTTKDKKKDDEKRTTIDMTGVSESKPWYKKPLILGIIGAVVVGGIVLALSGGGDEDAGADLADFPDPPQ